MCGVQAVKSGLSYTQLKKLKKDVDTRVQELHEGTNTYYEQ